MTTLPSEYRWLAAEPGPRMLVEGLATFGTYEVPGEKNSPTIMAWAEALGLEKVYRNDATAWCGLWAAIVAHRADYDRPPGPLKANPLWARNWLYFGQKAPVPMLGDVLVYERGSSGHVGLYVGEDASHFHTLGGNQSDQVCIRRIERRRLLGARRPAFRLGQPANVRQIRLAASGAASTSEA